MAKDNSEMIKNGSDVFVVGNGVGKVIAYDDIEKYYSIMNKESLDIVPKVPFDKVIDISNLSDEEIIQIILES